MLSGTRQAIGKRLCGCIVGTGVAREFVPKRKSELSGNRGRRPDDAVRLKTGERGGVALETCFLLGTCWAELSPVGAINVFVSPRSCE